MCVCVCLFALGDEYLICIAVVYNRSSEHEYDIIVQIISLSVCVCVCVCVCECVCVSVCVSVCV